MYNDFADREHDLIIKAIIETKKSVVMSDMRLAYHDHGANDITYNSPKTQDHCDSRSK